MINFGRNMNDVEEKTFEEFKKPEPGGYILQCIHIEAKKSKSGNDMLELHFDIYRGDFAGFFKEYPLKYYQLVREESLPYLKGMLSAFQKSCPNRLTPADISSASFDEQRLKGLIVGANLRNEEYQKQDTGEYKMSLKIAHFCNADDVLKGEVKPLSDKIIKRELYKPIQNTSVHDDGKLYDDLGNEIF